MFESLPANLNIYVTTASTPDESSWGTYCPPNDIVNGITIGTCLGDEYSVAWLEDADLKNSMKETLQVQYNNVKKNTAQSHPMQVLLILSSSHCSVVSFDLSFCCSMESWIGLHWQSATLKVVTTMILTEKHQIPCLDLLQGIASAPQSAPAMSNCTHSIIVISAHRPQTPRSAFSSLLFSSLS
jgi:hypothetical protein